MSEIDIRAREIKLVPIGEIKPDPKNRNKHSEEQITRLMELIKYQGFRVPLIVSNRTGLLRSGHGRLEAAKRLGLSHVPVIYQDFESEEQDYAFAVSDNSISAWAELDLSGINMDIPALGPDFDIDMLGLKDFVLEPAEKLEPQCDEDEVPEVQAESKVVLGDVFTLGRHRLMCGDSTSIDAVEKLMNGEKAELCFTSPPYSDQREYGGGLELSTEHLATFIRASFGSVNYFAVNLGYSRKNGEVNQYWDDYIKEAKGCGLKLLSWNVWDKGECGSIGNQSAMFGISHEWIFVFGIQPKDLNLTVPNKSAGEKANHTGNRQADGTIKKSKERIVRDFSQLKTVYSVTAQKARNLGINHPAMFPVEFPEHYIEAMTDEGDLVYEPFCGSGTTLIASEKMARNCMAMELDPKYCGVILDRWSKYTGKDPVRESDGKRWSEIKAETA